jgi:hypothetical protein
MVLTLVGAGFVFSRGRWDWTAGQWMFYGELVRSGLAKSFCNGYLASA